MDSSKKRTVGALLVALTSTIASLYGLTSTGASAAGANVDAQGNRRPDGCQVPTNKMTLYAQEIRRSDGSLKGLGWGTTPTNATTPGPTIEMIEGECLEITVVNDITLDTLKTLATKYVGYQHDRSKLGVSLHVHGVKYTTDSDGTINTGNEDSIVPPGRSRTYTWYAEPRANLANGLLSQGTAGYWWYHDHVVGTEHGTGGIYEGLYGALIVRRPQDPKPDVTYPLFMGPGKRINGQSHSHHDHATDCPGGVETPSPNCLIASRGQRVEFAVVNVGDEMHTFHLHGHSWADNRTGLLSSQADETRVIDAKIFGPSESFGFQIVAGHQVGPGHWMLHCHVQEHSDLGMVTFLRVKP